MNIMNLMQVGTRRSFVANAMKHQAIYSADPARGWLPWGALVPFLAIVLVALPDFVSSPVLSRLQLVDAHGTPIGLRGYYAFLLLTFALIALVVWAWVRFVERRSLASIGLVPRNAARSLVAGLAVGMGMSSAIVGGIWMAGGARADGFARAFATPINLLHMLLLLACFTFQSSVEEVVFRGWLLSGMARKLNIPIALVVTSLVFAFLHFSPRAHWLFLLNVFLFSVFACGWSLRSGNVWGVMGWHGAWNWLLGVGFETPVTGLDLKLPALIVRMIPGGPVFLTGGAEGPEGSIFCTAVLIVGTLFVLWRSRQGKRT